MMDKGFVIEQAAKINAEDRERQQTEEREAKTTAETIEDVNRKNAAAAVSNNGFKVGRRDNMGEYLYDCRAVFDAMSARCKRVNDKWIEAKEHYEIEMKNSKGELSEKDAILLKADYLEAEDNYKKGMAGAKDKYKNLCADVREEMVRHIEESKRIDPEALDEKTMHVLSLGIVGVADLRLLAERFADNPTMIRVLEKHAEKLAESGKSGDEREAAYMLKAELARMAEGKSVAVFDQLADWGSRALSYLPHETEFLRRYDEYFATLCRQLA